MGSGQHQTVFQEEDPKDSGEWIKGEEEGSQKKQSLLVF